MTDEKPRVIIIPPKPELQQTAAVTKQLRVAAYCRVSTKEEEQASSYEAQCEYYTDKIMSNKEWTMAGIFADEGITGTSTKKRTEFLRMIRQCKQKKIDLILTKSIQRFARNTLDCINYTRILRHTVGIGPVNGINRCCNSQLCNHRHDLFLLCLVKSGFSGCASGGHIFSHAREKIWKRSVLGHGGCVLWVQFRQTPGF